MESQGSNSYRYVRKFILKYVMKHNSFTVPAISELTGYSMTTISKFVNMMIDEKLLEIISYEEARRKGRRAVIYGVKPDSYYFLGVDVKNFDLVIGMMNFTGKLIKVYRNRKYEFEDTHANLDQLCGEIRGFIDNLEEEQRSRISAINLNLGGRVNAREGTSASVFNFEEMQDTPLAELLTENLGYPVHIENDTKAMTYGDYVAYGRQWKNMLYVNMGWGLGLGIIINGELYYGSNGYSGEMGHICAYNNNILCHCGKKGCIETEVSGSAVHRKIVESIRTGETSILSDKVRRGERISTEDIIEATEKEDPLCIEVVSRAATELGKHLAGMINLFNPDCIVIGGKLSKTAPYIFLQHTALAVKQYSLKLMSRNVPVLTSKLGDEAGVLGACMLARNHILFYSGK